mmetsp:Transcript_30757/g.65051  ORF Transcript_30757/g.65051 Transcript_30757/m.65051 type:complete len:316 (-) Transcript_30757:255-1202(-)
MSIPIISIIFVVVILIINGTLIMTTTTTTQQHTVIIPIPRKPNLIQLSDPMGENPRRLPQSDAVHLVPAALRVHPLGEAAGDAAVAEAAEVAELLEHGLPGDAAVVVVVGVVVDEVTVVGGGCRRHRHGRRQWPWMVLSISIEMRIVVVTHRDASHCEWRRRMIPIAIVATMRPVVVVVVVAPRHHDSRWIVTSILLILIIIVVVVVVVHEAQATTNIVQRPLGPLVDPTAQPPPVRDASHPREDRLGRLPRVMTVQHLLQRVRALMDLLRGDVVVGEMGVPRGDPVVVGGRRGGGASPRGGGCCRCHLHAFRIQ